MPADLAPRLREILAQALFPGAGFFGFTNDFRAEIAVGGMVDEVHLSLGSPTAEFINIAEISFFDAAGQEIPRATLDTGVEMSSVWQDRHEGVADAFLSGRVLHTKREEEPWIAIRLAAPVFLSRLTIRNRNDENRRRARDLRAEIRHQGRAVARWKAGIAAPQALLDELLERLGMALPVMGNAADIAAEIREKAAAAALAGTLDWDIRKAAQMLPVHDKEPPLDEAAITLAAWAVCRLMRDRNAMETKDLRDLGNALHTPEILAGLQRKGTEILRVEGDGAAELVLSKHMILRRAVLLQHKEAYLAALDTVFPLLAEMGKQAVLCYGSLLGAVRDRGFMPHDDDVDVLYFDGATSHEEALANREALIARLEQAGYVCWGINENFHLHVEGKSIDLFPCWKEGGNLHLLMEKYRYRAIPFDIVFPAGQVDLYGHTYPAPADSAAFLLERYGSGWTEPNPWHEWPWKLSRETQRPKYDGNLEMTITVEHLPVHYWDIHVNFGDLLTPWIVEAITGRPTVLVKDNLDKPHYVLVGSILSHVRSGSIVWGTGSFGTEVKKEINIDAKYLAVRGPLTRNKIITMGGKCPTVYGDPGLLAPCFYKPNVEKKHEVGVIIRHSEDNWRKSLSEQSLKFIDLKTDQIEDTIDEINSCKRIVSSSLHGLILADAYGIPNAWLESTTPWGRDFKYWDYLISVDKIRHPTSFNFSKKGLDVNEIIDAFFFDDRLIKININALIDANPFGWNPSEEIINAISIRN